MPQNNPDANGAKEKSVFIAGDDTTTVLSPRVMSDADVSVMIRTHKAADV